MLLSAKFLGIVLLLCLVHDASSYPKPDVEKKGDHGATKDVKTKGKLPDSGSSHRSTKKKITHKSKREGGAIEGFIEIPDEVLDDFVKSETVDENDMAGSKSHGEALTDSNEGQEGDTVSGKTDDVVDSHQDNGQDGEDGKITGSIEIKDDGGIDGTINIPDDFDNEQIDTNNSDDGHGGGEDDITGSIDIKNDGSIEGTVNIPDDVVLDHEDGHNVDLNPGDDGNEGNGNGGISGEVVIDDEGNVEGEVNIPDDDDTPAYTNNNDEPSGNSPTYPKNPSKGPESRIDKNSCWLNLNSNQYLDDLNAIDDKYRKARQQFQDEIGPGFDKKMIEVLLSTQGKAARAVHQARGDPNIIPAGLNLGGFGMMRMPGSMIFFHRMKLRNSTVFRVDFLQANLVDMALVARLSLNDLHLRGSYERATTVNGMAQMFINPTYGELDILIKSVYYKMEGRLRLLNNRLILELVNSAILTQEILLEYANSTESAKNMDVTSIEDFVGRMKCDIDLWLKDYFNDYLMYFGIVGSGKNSEIQLYEKEKTIKANEYADHAIKGIKKKLRDIKSANVKLPSFTLLSVMSHRVELKNGILRGLDSIHRRSVAMTKKEKDVRVLDIMVGFSNLKVQYTYEATVIRDTPPLTGQLTLTADELTAHLEISQADGAQTPDINIDSIIQIKPESLTVEGPANRLIADFKYILENPIIAIMSNVLKHNVKMLRTLTRCEPKLWGDGSEHNPYNIKKDDNFIPPDNTVVHSNEPNGQFNSDEDDTKKEWADYVFSKNDSVEVEVPVDGKMEKMKLHRIEKMNDILNKEVKEEEEQTMSITYMETNSEKTGSKKEIDFYDKRAESKVNRTTQVLEYTVKKNYKEDETDKKEEIKKENDLGIEGEPYDIQKGDKENKKEIKQNKKETEETTSEDDELSITKEFGIIEEDETYKEEEVGVEKETDYMQQEDEKYEEYAEFTYEDVNAALANEDVYFITQEFVTGKEKAFPGADKQKEDVDNKTKSEQNEKNKIKTLVLQEEEVEVEEKNVDNRDSDVNGNWYSKNNTYSEKKTRVNKEQWDDDEGEGKVLENEVMAKIKAIEKTYYASTTETDDEDDSETEEDTETDEGTKF